MESTFYAGLEYAKAESSEITEESFQWGDQEIKIGHVFDEIGSKKRSQLKLDGAKLKYAGRVGSELLFAVVFKDLESSEDGWYICASYVNATTLLMQGSYNGFWDIKF